MIWEIYISYIFYWKYSGMYVTTLRFMETSKNKAIFWNLTEKLEKLGIVVKLVSIVIVAMILTSDDEEE